MKRPMQDYDLDSEPNDSDVAYLVSLEMAELERYQRRFFGREGTDE